MKPRTWTSAASTPTVVATDTRLRLASLMVAESSTTAGTSSSRRCGRRLVQAVAVVEAAQRRGRPPVALAQQLHGRRHEQRAHERGVDDDGDGQADTELLDGEDLAGGEPGEDHDDERRCRGDDPPRALQAHGDGEVVVAGLVVHLLDAGEQEHLVVHRQAEGEDQDQHGHPQVEGADGVEAEQSRQVTFLEDPHHRAEAGAQAEDVHQHGLERARRASRSS